MNLFTKEDIEKTGFTFEPDVTKCQTRKIRLHFDCNYYKDGKWSHRSTPTVNDEWKSMCGEVVKTNASNWSYIHSVFVPEVEPQSGQGVLCRWVMIEGHS
jgi:hypothetical protein